MVFVAAAVLFGAGCDSSTTVEEPPPPSEPPLEPVPDESRAAVVAFVDVHVVPMDRERVLEHQTVLVRDGVIADIGPVDALPVPSGAAVVPGSGRRYLMPGLVDAHVHLNSDPHEVHNDHILFLANGVTTIREMWGTADRLSLSERGAIAAGVRLGPTIYAASPGMDGPGGPWSPGTPAIETVEQARATVADHAARGYDFIKVYNLLSRPVYEAIIDEAAAHGVRVIGHVPRAVGIGRVLDSGQVTLEHLIGFGLAASSTGSIHTGTLDDDHVRRFADAVRRAGAYVTPTISVLTFATNDKRPTTEGDAYRYISPTMQRRYANGFFQGYSTDQAQRALQNCRDITRAIAEAGGGLLLGTDAGFGYMLQGFTVHEELAHLQAAGLTPFQALRAGTATAGEFLQGGPFGKVLTGHRADVLLVDKNPLEDVAHVARERAGVMVRGRWFSQTRLQQMLDAIADEYGQ